MTRTGAIELANEKKEFEQTVSKKVEKLAEAEKKKLEEKYKKDTKDYNEFSKIKIGATHSLLLLTMIYAAIVTIIEALKHSQNIKDIETGGNFVVSWLDSYKTLGELYTSVMSQDWDLWLQVIAIFAVGVLLLLLLYVVPVVIVGIACRFYWMYLSDIISGYVWLLSLLLVTYARDVLPEGWNSIAIMLVIHLIYSVVRMLMQLELSGEYTKIRGAERD